MTEQKSSPHFTLADHLTLLLAEGFGLGRIPFAPGTFGSLWGILIGWGLWRLRTSPVERIVFCGVLFLPGIAICQRAAELRKVKDPGSIVWDEITAFPMVYAFATLNWTWLIVGFVLFRFFDIVKPWPVRQLEQLPGGLGIITDDVVAGMYAAACLTAIQFCAG